MEGSNGDPLRAAQRCQEGGRRSIAEKRSNGPDKVWAKRSAVKSCGSDGLTRRTQASAEPHRDYEYRRGRWDGLGWFDPSP